MSNSDADLSGVIDIVTGHLAGRRDALNAVAQLGNRFEDWFKWEVLIALHNALLVKPKPWFSCAGVERSETETDVFIGLNEWSFKRRTQAYQWPGRSERDVWLELKARTTRDKGGGEVAAWLGVDIKKLRNRIKNGRGVACALLLQHPGVSDVAEMASDAEEVLGPAPFKRTIYDHSLNAASHPDDTTFTVTPTPLAVVVAWPTR